MEEYVEVAAVIILWGAIVFAIVIKFTDDRKKKKDE